MPVPQTKRGGAQLQFDNEWTLNRIQPNDFINDVRSRVDLWRQRGHAHITPTTRRLLEYWSDEQLDRRLRKIAVHEYFASNWAMVWQIVSDELPPLRGQILAVLHEESPEIARQYEQRS